MLSTLAPIVDIPRPGVDPINTTTEKLGIFALALRRPLRDETIALCLDQHRHGVGLFAFASGKPLTEVIDRVIGAAINIEATAAISLLSSRSGRGRVHRDASQFFMAKNRCADAGLWLDDWLLVAEGDAFKLG
ncbi:MAG: hypothetical protein ACKOFM_05460 [Actinomycetota bacterium]